MRLYSSLTLSQINKLLQAVHSARPTSFNLVTNSSEKPVQTNWSVWLQSQKCAQLDDAWFWQCSHEFVSSWSAVLSSLMSLSHMNLHIQRCRVRSQIYAVSVWFQIMSFNSSHSHKCITQKPVFHQQRFILRVTLICILNFNRAFIIRISLLISWLSDVIQSLWCSLEQTSSTEHSSQIKILKCSFCCNMAWMKTQSLLKWKTFIVLIIV